eukprot:scaffold2318_cov396-Prasinococcus_capsulatus_cf.AAC.4
MQLAIVTVCALDRLAVLPHRGLVVPALVGRGAALARIPGPHANAVSATSLRAPTRPGTLARALVLAPAAPPSARIHTDIHTYARARPWLSRPPARRRPLPRQPGPTPFRPAADVVRWPCKLPARPIAGASEARNT